MKNKNFVIVLASGQGKRFQSDTPKQFLKLAGKTVLEHTLDIFERHTRIDEIIIVCAPDSRLLIEEIVNSAGYRKVRKVVRGGETRQASSASGIAAVVGDKHKVLVHDGVRPLLDWATIDRCLEALDRYDAVDTAIPASDTIVQCSSDDRVENIPDRSELRLGQTPQGFRAGVLRKAHELAATDRDVKVTDDCGLVLYYGLGDVYVVAGDVNNIKITYPSDIYLADRIFQLRGRAASATALLTQLKEKVVVVFGASRGIGQSVAKLVSDYGGQVRTASRRTGVDVSNPAQVQGFLSETVRIHQRLDIVVNTAGTLHAGLLSGQDYATIDEQIATNIRGSVIVAREAFDIMRSHGGSIALFTSSSYTRGRARYAVYSATKAAIVNLVQGLAEEFQSFGVRINAINPERTATPMRTENFGNEDPSELLDAETVARATLAAALSDANGEVIDIRR